MGGGEGRGRDIEIFKDEFEQKRKGIFDKERLREKGGGWEKERWKRGITIENLHESYRTLWGIVKEGREENLQKGSGKGINIRKRGKV